LSEPPYCLNIKDDEGYTLFEYSLIKGSDFHNPIVKECRGIILDLAGAEPHVVCRGFDKFGNYGESYVDDIDWASARVQEKIDGSICKLWFDKGNWHISSGGMIDAYKANLTCSKMNLGDIFQLLFDEFLFEKLDKDYTYIFECVSPYNRVVIKYDQPKLYLIGKRNNKTGEEVIPEDLGIARPLEYNLSSVEECIEAAKKLNTENEIKAEGFVVVDKNWHRIKIKSPEYVAVHYVKTKRPSYKDLVRIWKQNEVEEFLSYYPAYKEQFKYFDCWAFLLKEQLYNAKIVWNWYRGNKKSYCLKVKDWTFSGFCTEAMKFNDWSIDRVLDLPIEKLVRYIKDWEEKVVNK